jgi:hypothetical protein
MKSGVYALYWWNSDLIYVGVSQDIYSRKEQHLRLLKRGAHYNSKVQQAYNSFGIPEFILLELAGISELSYKEYVWFNEFNVLGLQGLNIAEPGIHSEQASKYSKLTILKVFRELYLTTNTFNVISNKFNTTPEFAINIFYTKTHLWLQEKYPYQYSIMKSKIRKSNSFAHKLRSDSALLISPTYEIFECHNIKEFARTHNLIPQNLGEVIRGKRLTHKGWKVYEG